MNFSLIPYDSEQHGAFVMREVRRCAYKYPYATPGSNHAATGRWLADVVRRATVANPSGCWVAMDVEQPDVCLSVLLSPGPQQIAWAYTKYPVRHNRLATALAERVGIDFSKPTYVSIWTYAASRIAASGYRLVPAMWEVDE